MANYLYNGVELPDINSIWTNKETYPYASLAGNAENGYILIVESGRMTYSNGQMIGAAGVYRSYKYAVGDYGWTFLSEGESVAGALDEDPEEWFWTSVDILDTDTGVVYLAASDPVLVTYPIAAGTYRCQATPSGDGLILFELAFSSNGTGFTEIGYGQEGITEGAPGRVYYFGTDEDTVTVYSSDTGWADENYRTITIAETQRPTVEAYTTWFSANYTLVDDTDDDTDDDYDGVLDDGAEFEETYAVTGDALVATANAIRAKTGGTSRIKWKTDGFAEAVGGISGGGKSDDTVVFEWDGQPTEITPEGFAEAFGMYYVSEDYLTSADISDDINLDFQIAAVDPENADTADALTAQLDNFGWASYVTVDRSETGDGNVIDVISIKLDGTTAVFVSPEYSAALEAEEGVAFPVGTWMVSEGEYYLAKCTRLGERSKCKKTIEKITNRLIQSIETEADNVGDYAFHGCILLNKASVPNAAVIEDYAFAECGFLAEIYMPAVEKIGTYAFYSCGDLTEIEFPKSLTKIGTKAFYYCVHLAKVTFNSTPESIAEDAFRSTKYGIVFNVPWAEGEVENAPWGASGATINYNYGKSEE